MVPIVTEGAQEALSILTDRNDIELVILDMMMPEMDGIQLACEIRKLKHGVSLPLILLSSFGEFIDSGDINFFAQLIKPAKSSRLLNVIGEAIGGKSAAKRTPKPTDDQPSNLAEGHPLNILIAEDNVVNQKVLLRMLERLGYQADVVSNGLEAVTAVKLRQYDVVLMDVEMPEMDGPTAAKQIHAELPAVDSPKIVAVTAKALSGDREKLLNEGMDDYISKPIKLEDLAEKLMQCTPLKANQQE